MSELNERDEFLITYLAQIDAGFINDSLKISIEKGLRTFKNSMIIFSDYIEGKYKQPTLKTKNEYEVYIKELLRCININIMDISHKNTVETIFKELRFSELLTNIVDNTENMNKLKKAS